MKLLYQNGADSAAMGANPPMQATLPVTNLQTQFREEVARSTSLAPQDITLTWATPQAIQAAVLYRCNLSSAALMRLRVWDSPTLGPMRTNLVLYSVDLTQASAWVKTNAIVLQNAYNAPDGTLTADKIAAAITGVCSTVQTFALSPDTPYVASVCVHDGSAGALEVGLYDNTGAGWALLGNVNLTTGATSITSGLGVVRATSLVGGWWRLTLVVTTSANTSFDVRLYPRAAAGSTAGDYVYLSQTQVEVAAYYGSDGIAIATSYIPTAAAAATASGEPATLRYDSGFVGAAFPKPLGDLVMGVDALGAAYFDGWGYNVARLFLSTPVMGRYAVLTILDPYNVAGYIQASRLLIGPVWTPTYGPAPGSGVQWNEGTVQTRTEGGSVRSEPGASYRTIIVSLKYLPEADRQQLSALLGKTGMRGDCYVSLFPGAANALERDTQMQAKLATLAATPFTATVLVDQQLQFDEV